MKQTRYRLMHQVVSDDKGRPKILHVVVNRASGAQVAGPYYDWRLAQQYADRLNSEDEATGTAAPAPFPAAPLQQSSGGR